MIKLFKLFIISVFFIAFSWFIGLLIFTTCIDNYDKNNEKTDAIVVLTGGKNRIKEAKKLFNEDFADKMFISGVSKEVSLDDIIKPEEVKIIYKNKIEIGQEAKNTVENAIEINEWILKNDIKSIRLVTSNYHMPRSLEEIKSKNDDVKIIIHPVFTDNLSKHWWSSRKTFRFIASEYNKFLFAYIKNGFNNLIGSEKQ